VGAYNADGDGIRHIWLAMIGPAGSCPESLIAQEGAYTTALEWARDYVVVEGQLEIRTARGEVLTYEPLAPEADRDLEGSRWRLLAMLENRTVEGMELALPMPVDRLPSSEVTVEYNEGTMSGSAGCNAYSAAYTSQDLRLSIGPIVRTEMVCESPPGVMEQEQRYLDYLVNVTRHDIAGDQLWLETDDESALIFVAEGTAYNLADLMADLRAAGFAVEVAQRPVDHGFAIDGVRVDVDGAAIYGYEFADVAAADAAASGVSADERSITVTRSEGERTVETHGDWAETPRLYRKGRLIVIAGDHPGILGALGVALGPPFAPRALPGPGSTCETYTAALALSASDTTLQVGDVLTVTATLSNEGCGSLGMPQYRLYIESDATQPLFDPATPEPVLHSLGISPGQSDAVAFALRAVHPGGGTLRAGTSFEFHVGYPGPAYWGGSGSEPLSVAVTEP
jgi:heat shock protein HslJ